MFLVFLSHLSITKFETIHHRYIFYLIFTTTWNCFHQVNFSTLATLHWILPLNQPEFIQWLGKAQPHINEPGEPCHSYTNRILDSLIPGNQVTISYYRTEQRRSAKTIRNVQKPSNALLGQVQANTQVARALLGKKPMGIQHANHQGKTSIAK